MTALVKKQSMPGTHVRLPDEDVAAIAARLRELRLAHGYEERPTWARFLGLKRAALGHYEDGLRMISLPAAIRYCKRTGISLDWIYRGVEDALPMHVKRKLDDYRQGLQDGVPRPHSGH